jgi:hypothetical protein
MYESEAQEENKTLLVSGRISFAFRILVYFYPIRKSGIAAWYCHICLSIRFSPLMDFCFNFVRTSYHGHPQQARTMNTSNTVATCSFIICPKKGSAKA